MWPPTIFKQIFDSFSVRYTLQNMSTITLILQPHGGRHRVTSHFRCWTNFIELHDFYGLVCEYNTRKCTHISQTVQNTIDQIRFLRFLLYKNNMISWRKYLELGIWIAYELTIFLSAQTFYWIGLHNESPHHPVTCEHYKINFSLLWPYCFMLWYIHAIDFTYVCCLSIAFCHAYQNSLCNSSTLLKNSLV